MAAVELHDPRRHPPQKGAVVGDEYQRRAAPDEELLHPLDRVHVEMVRRLVEQQHVGLPHERPCQQRLPLPPTRGGRELRVRIESEVLQHGLHARLELPRAGDVQLVVQLASSRSAASLCSTATRWLAAWYRDSSPPAVAEPLGHDVERRSGDVVGNFLRQPGDGDSRLPDDIPLVRHDAAVEQLHHSRLPRAVPTEQADALTALDAEVGPIEDGRSPEGDAEGPERDEGHGKKLAGDAVIPSERSESRDLHSFFLAESAETTEPGAAISPSDH